MSSKIIVRFVLLFIACEVLCTSYAQSTSKQTVEEAINFFRAETVKMITELEKQAGKHSDEIQGRIDKTLEKLHRFRNYLDEYSQSVDFEKDKDSLAKPYGNYRREFLKLNETYSLILADIGPDSNPSDFSQKSSVEEPLTTQQSQNKSKLEEKMEDWIDFQRTNYLINLITLLLFVVTLTILLIFRNRIFGARNNDPGANDKDIKTINSVLSNLQHKIDVLTMRISSSSSSAIDEKFNEINGSVDTMRDVLQNLVEKVKDLKGHQNSVEPTPPSPLLQQVQVNTSLLPDNTFNVSTRNPDTAESSLVHYSVENIEEVRSLLGIEKPVFVKDPQGECLINELTNEMTIDESVLFRDWDKPVEFLSMFYELRGNTSLINSLKYDKKARVKKDGQKWVLTDKGVLELK